MAFVFRGAAGKMPYRIRTGPSLAQYCQHRPNIGPVRSHYGMFIGIDNNSYTAPYMHIAVSFCGDPKRRVVIERMVYAQ